jgi:hypothetical protein
VPPQPGAASFAHLGSALDGFITDVPTSAGLRSAFIATVDARSLQAAIAFRRRGVSVRTGILYAACPIRPTLNTIESD